MNEESVAYEITDGPRKEGLEPKQDVWFHLNGDAPPELLGSIPFRVSVVHRKDDTTVVVEGKPRVPGFDRAEAAYDPQRAKGIIHLYP